MPDASGEPATETPAELAAKRVYLGLPHSGSMCPETMMSLGQASSKRTLDVSLGFHGSSLLCRNFNALWCEALNQEPRPDYCAMHHSDIVAPPGWLDVLVANLEETGADMVSAVVAIKDYNGLTSTAVLDLAAKRRRRLTVTECLSLPEVFGAEEAGALYGIKPSDAVLLVNTGLWVCRFAGNPWIEDVCFQTGDEIRKGEDGKFRAHVFPEDWLWSLTLHNKGLKVIAARTVETIHFGRTPFVIGKNVWGGLKEDPWVDT